MWKLWNRGWTEYVVTVIAAVFAALTVRTVFITAYRVPSGSMRPALLPGDFIFANRLAYSIRFPLIGKPYFFNSPQRGELVVFSYPDRPDTVFVKRVIGVEGDRIDIQGNQVFLNKIPFEYIPAVNIDNPDDESFQMMIEKGFGLETRIITQKQNDTRDESKSLGPFVVPPGFVFLMGDNRDTSDDSRFWGPVPVDHIIGRASVIWLSVDLSARSTHSPMLPIRWERQFQRIQ